jgi:hypothetical protein
MCDAAHSERRNELHLRMTLAFKEGVWPSDCSPAICRHSGRDERVARALSREPPELHALACFVHGALTALHVLGAVYNCRRRNWWDVMAHLAAAAYDARSVRHHYRVEQIARLRQSSSGRPDDGHDRLAPSA